MNEDQNPQPKLSLVEIIVGGFYVTILDAIGILLAFFVLDDFFILDILAAPLSLYFWFKGIGAQRQVGAWLAEFIPLVGDLPILSVGFWATVWLDRHPKAAAVAEKAAVAKGGAGKKVVAQQRQAASMGKEMGKGSTKATRSGLGAQYANNLEFEEKVGMSAGKEVPEEAFGLEKEPIEKVIDITKKLPEPELEENYREAA